MSEVVKIFEIFDTRFEITKEFDEYNKVRSEQSRQVFGVAEWFRDVENQMLADYQRIAKPATDTFLELVNTKINSPLDVAAVGFNALKHCQNEVLPRIGKRLIFKYMKNELITVEEVANKIEFNAADYFASFISEVEQMEERQQSHLLSQEYKRLVSGDISSANIVGFGVAGTVGAAAGAITADIGLSILRGIGRMAGRGISSAIATKEAETSVKTGKDALWKAYNDVHLQVWNICLAALEEKRDAKQGAIDSKPFVNVSDEKFKEITAKAENYIKALKDDDITVERYAAHICSIFNEASHNPTLYYPLYETAYKDGNEATKKAVAELMGYLGFEGRLERWLSQKGYEPKKLESEDIHDPKTEPDSKTNDEAVSSEDSNIDIAATSHTSDEKKTTEPSNVADLPKREKTAPINVFSAGQTVFARFSSGKFYFPGVIGEIIGDSAKINYLDGDKETVPIKDIIALEEAFRTLRFDGDWDNQGSWYNGVISKTHPLTMKYNDGYVEQIQLKQLRGTRK